MIPEYSEFKEVKPPVRYVKKNRDKWRLGKVKKHGQSPINILRENTTKEWFMKLTFPELMAIDKQTTLENDGHTLKVYIGGDGFVCGGPLFGFYKFLQMHFHWSESNMTGTEHALNGKRYSCESHFVFEKSVCTDCLTSEREDRPHLCVVGILFEVNDQAPVYRVFNYLPHLLKENDSIRVDGNLLIDFAYALRDEGFYNYSGSLTTPPFSENVEWIVYENVYFILPDQLNMLRQMTGHDGPISNNVRGLQPLGDRQVLSSVNQEDEDWHPVMLTRADPRKILKNKKKLL